MVGLMKLFESLPGYISEFPPFKANDAAGDAVHLFYNQTLWLHMVG